MAIAGRGESLRGGITPCDLSSRQFNFAGCPLGRVWRSCRVYRENCNDWFRRILLKNSQIEQSENLVPARIVLSKQVVVTASLWESHRRQNQSVRRTPKEFSLEAASGLPNCDRRKNSSFSTVSDVKRPVAESRDALRSWSQVELRVVIARSSQLERCRNWGGFQAIRHVVVGPPEA